MLIVYCIFNVYDWCIAQSSLHTSYHSISHSQLPQWACTARRLLLPKHCDSRPPSQLIIRFAWCLCRVFRRPCDGRTNNDLRAHVRGTVDHGWPLFCWTSGFWKNMGEPGCPHYPNKRRFKSILARKKVSWVPLAIVPYRGQRWDVHFGMDLQWTPSACTAPLVWLFWRGQCDRRSVWPSASAHNPRFCCTYDNYGYGSFWAQNSSPAKQQMMVMFRTKMYQGTSSRQRGAGKPLPIITEASPWCFLMILIDLEHTIVIYI